MNHNPNHGEHKPVFSNKDKLKPVLANYDDTDDIAQLNCGNLKILRNFNTIPF